MRWIAIRRMRARSRTICALALAAALAAGCGQELDPTGRAVREEPVTLTLANHKGGAAYVQAWADAVQRLSGGSIRIRIANSWRRGETNYEQATLEDVRSGKVPLAIVAARAYDEVGVTSFQPLLAPLLVDSRSLEQRLLAGPIGRQALAGTGKLGLVGLALLPTEMRRLVGLSRTVAAPGDLHGGRVYVREGRIARETFQALGAEPIHRTTEQWYDSVDVAEVGMEALRGALLDAGPVAGVTANVALWPMPMTIVMDREAYDDLASAQQAVLRRAVADPDFARDYRFVADLEDENVDIVCRAGTNMVAATPAQLNALKAAVRPVYELIERGPGNRATVERIEALKRDAQPDVLACGAHQPQTVSTGQPAPELDGTYHTSFSERELAESPLLADGGELNDENWGDQTLRLSNGRFHATQRNARASSKLSGRYSTAGNTIELVTETGETFTLRWSLYRGALKFERDEKLGSAPTPLILKPWRRVR